jgi:hypothetical protein
MKIQLRLGNDEFKIRKKSTYNKGLVVLAGRILLGSPGRRLNSGPFSSMQFAELLLGLQCTHWYLALCVG